MYFTFERTTKVVRNSQFYLRRYQMNFDISKLYSRNGQILFEKISMKMRSVLSLSFILSKKKWHKNSHKFDVYLQVNIETVLEIFKSCYIGTAHYSFWIFFSDTIDNFSS